VLSGGIGLLIGTVAIRALLDAAARHGGPLGPASVLALAGGLALLAVPMVLLGAVLPYAVRLQLPGAVYAGGLVGRFYAISTAGSLAGTFVVVLALDPALGALDSCVVLGLLVAGTSLAAFALTRTSGAGGGREAAARPRASEPSAARGVGRVSHGA
jgi:hypothetical protein